MSECGKIRTRKNSLSGHFSSSVMWITFSALSKHSFQWKRLQDVLKTSFVFVFRRGLQGVFKTSWSRRIYSSWSYILKTPSRRFQDLLKTSSRRLAKMSSKHLQDVLKTFWRRLERRVQLVFETYWEDDYLQKALPRSHFWEIYGQGTIFPIANSLDIPKLLKQFFLKTIYKVTASVNKDALVKVGIRNEESMNKSSSKNLFLRF